MLHNLSMSTGFSFNSNVLTGHEHVLNSYIDAYMYTRSPVYTPAFVMPLLETVTSSGKRKSEVSSIYRVTKHRKQPSHSRAKRKSLIIIRIEEALWRGSLAVEDHLRSILWIICGLRIICGTVQYFDFLAQQEDFLAYILLNVW